MQRQKSPKEWIKTIFIVMLSISAVALGLGTGLFDAPIRAGGLHTAIEEMRPPRPSLQGAAPAAWPTAAMATAARDVHLGYRMAGQAGEWPHAGPQFIFSTFSGSLGEALGSSGPPVTVSQTAWEEALLGPGVFFRYDLEVPGDILAQWFGVSPGGALGPMQLICLSVGADTVYLYYMGRDGIPHRSTTALRPADLLESLLALEPNGAAFGFPQSIGGGMETYTVLLPRYSGIPILWEANAIGAVHGERDAFLTHLGMNPALVRTLDEVGSRTIVEENATLRLYEDGLIRYQYQDIRPYGGEGITTLAQAIETAREIASVLLLVSGEADIYLTDSSQDEAGFVLEFRYYMGGLPVWTDRPAATVIIQGGRVTEVTLLARSYERSGAFSAILPEAQATAAAGGPLFLTYAPAGGREPPAQGVIELRAMWLLVNPAGEG